MVVEKREKNKYDTEKGNCEIEVFQYYDAAISSRLKSLTFA